MLHYHLVRFNFFEVGWGGKGAKKKISMTVLFFKGHSV